MSHEALSLSLGRADKGRVRSYPPATAVLAAVAGGRTSGASPKRAGPRGSSQTEGALLPRRRSDQPPTPAAAMPTATRGSPSAAGPLPCSAAWPPVPAATEVGVATPYGPASFSRAATCAATIGSAVFAAATMSVAVPSAIFFSTAARVWR